jgi:ABC-type transport system involved in multi-copper enzyme maturation permease subunit
MNIIKHYFKRYAIDPLGVGIYVFFPVILLALFSVVNVYNAEENNFLLDGRDLAASYNMIVNLLIFQFMGSLLVIDFLHTDLRQDMRWRLGMVPVPRTKLVFGNMAGAFTFSFLSGLFVIGVSGIFFNAYMHNLVVLLAVLVFVALISQLVGVLLFFLCAKKSTANTLGSVFCWGMVLLSGMMMGINLGTALTDIGTRYTPFGIAVRAIIYSGGVTRLDDAFGGFSGGSLSGAWLNVGYLAGITAVLFALVILMSRRRVG